MSFAHLERPAEADDGLRYVVFTRDPQRGRRVWWDGGRWSLYEDEAALFRIEGGTRHTAETIYTPPGAPTPEVGFAPLKDCLLK